MKFFIKLCLYTLALTAPCGTVWCLKTVKIPKVTIPLKLTNTSPTPITVQLDLRVDYYYTHGHRKTFLPANKVNQRLLIKPQETATVAIALPQGLHEPYNSIKKKIRAKNYELSDITLRGVIIRADNPKQFTRVLESLSDKDSLSIKV